MPMLIASMTLFKNKKRWPGRIYCRWLIILQRHRQPLAGTIPKGNPLPSRLKADLVLALALVHHLAIANNVPLTVNCRLVAADGRLTSSLNLCLRAMKK